MSPEIEVAAYVAAAALGGAAVGVERQRSGHASGPHARFAGVRTFTLLGGLAGIAGTLWRAGDTGLATALMLGAVGLVIAGYAAASRDHVDGTTEVAALVVLAAGVLAGTGELAIASGTIALTTLLLVEKSRLHAWVARIDDVGLRAGIRFAVLAIVVLPLLPVGPYGPFGGVRPRQLWALVLVFAGLSFLGYVARRLVGPRHGYPVTGALGGMISSTSVSLVFARESADPRAPGLSLACGVVAACTVMFVRVLVATAILDWALALRLALPAAVPFVVGSVATLALLRRTPSPRRESLALPENPLQLRSALQMAGLFQLAVAGLTLVRGQFGDLGLLASGAVLGLTDVDALTFSIVDATAQGVSRGLAAQALAIGMLANTLLKLALVVVLGRHRFRVAAGVALAVVAAAAAAVVIVPIGALR